MRKILFAAMVCFAVLAVVSGFGLLKGQSADFEVLECGSVTVEYGELLSLPIADFVRSNGTTLALSVVAEKGRIENDFLVIDSKSLSCPNDIVKIVVQSERSRAVVPIEIEVENPPPPPALVITNQKLFEGEFLEIDLKEHTTSDSESIFYEIVSGVGEIQGTEYRYSAGLREAPVAHRVTIKAIDELGQWRCETFSIIVMDKNHWPEEPHSPYPDDGVEDFMNDLVLSWKCEDPDGDSLSYSLYFGAERLEVLAEEITETTYSLSSLEPGTEYSWQVLADDGKGGVIRGPIWSFRTKKIPSLTWKRVIGFDGRDSFAKIRPLSDGGFILAGSVDAEPVPNSSAKDLSRAGWVVKLDGNGYFAWQKKFDFGWTEFNDIIPTYDNGFLVAGKNLGLTSPESGEESSLLAIKLNRYANESWRFTVGGNQNEAVAVVEVEDGYLILGTKSSDNREEKSVVLIKLDRSGSEVWQKSFGGSSFERAVDFNLDPKGDIVIVAETTSMDGEAEGNTGSSLSINGLTLQFSSILVIKVGINGEVLWSKVLGGESEDFPSSVKVDANGNIFVGGSTSSTGGTFSRQTSDYDGFIIKLSEVGEILWTKCLGGKGNDFVEDFFVTPSGGIQAIGFSESNLERKGSESSSLKRAGLAYSDIWLLQLDVDGNLLWENYLGGELEDVSLTVARSGNGFALAGFSASSDGDVGSNKGDYDALVFYLE